MMIMEGSKMSQTEYNLKVIMYSAYDTSYKLYNISSSYILLAMWLFTHTGNEYNPF